MRRNLLFISLAVIFMGGPAVAEDNLAQILAGLASEKSTERITAVQRAGQTHHPLFVAPLAGLVGSDPDADVRSASALALGELGVPTTSADLELLLNALYGAVKDADLTVAQSGFSALSRFPFPAVRDRLMKLSQDKALSTNHRQSATEALKKPLLEEALERMKSYLFVSTRESKEGRADPETRFGVPQESLLRFVRDLLDPHANHDDATRAIASWPSESERLPFLVRALREPGRSTRRAAALGLARSKTRASWLALQPVLDDRDLEVRRHAAEGLAHLKEPAVAVALTERLRSEPDRKLRRGLQQTLLDQPASAVLAALLSWDETVPDNVRLAGLKIARVAQTATRAADVLVKFMAEAKGERIAARARKYLKERPDRQVVTPLLAKLADSQKGSTVRKRVLDALAGREADEAVTGALLDLVGRGVADDQVLALLAQQDESLVRPQMLFYLQSAYPPTRNTALDGVERYQGEDVVNALAEVLDKHPDEDRAFSLLRRQPIELSLGALLDLLANKKQARRHRTILGLLERDGGQTDPRIATPVVAAVLNDPGLAHAGIRSIGRQDSMSAIPALSEVAGSKKVNADARAKAVEALATFEEDRVHELLRPLAADEELEVRMAARNALHELAPEVYPSWDPYGRVPLVAESALFGAGLMLLAADIADAELSPVFTGGVGLVLGGATPFLLTMNEDVTLGDAGYFGTIGLWGTLAGWGLGGSFGLDKTDTQWLTLAGETVGLTTAALTMRYAEWGLDEVMLANFTAAEAALTTAALGSLYWKDDPDRSRKTAHAALLGGAVSMVPMALLSRQLSVEEDLLLVGTAMSHGAWLGFWAPGIFVEDGLSGTDALASAAAGQGIGFLAGLAFAQFTDLSSQTALFSALGTLSGAATFGGFGLFLEEDLSSQSKFALLEGGSAAGALALAFLAPHLAFHENDVAIVALTTAAGAFGGSEFSVRLEEERFDEASFPGGVLMGAGLGLASGLLVSQLIDASDTELQRSLLGGGLFGAAGMGFGYLVPDLNVRSRSRITGLAAVGGVLLTAPFAERLTLEAEQLSYAAVGASAGALFGGFLPAYWHEEGEGLPASESLGGVTFGASFGLLAGATIAQALDLRLKDVGMVALGLASGTGIGAGLGMVVPSFDRKTTVGLMQGVGLLGMTLTSVLVNARSLDVSRQSGGSPALAHAGFFAAHGAFHGGLIPYMWRDENPPAQEVTGGVLLGAGLGASTGLLVSKLLEEPLTDDDLIEGSILAVAANGVGAGIGLLSQERRLGAGLMQGLGIAGYGTALALSPHTSYGVSDVPIYALGLSTLGWFGGCLPFTFQEDRPANQQIAGGVALGTSLGLLGTSAYVQFVPAEEREELEVLLTTAAAGGMGAGLGLMLGEPDQTAFSLMEGVGVTGLVTGLLVADQTEYDEGDLALLGLGAAFGTWQGVNLPGVWQTGEVPDREQRGGALFGGSLGYLAGMTASQLVTADPLDVLEVAFFVSYASGLGAGLTEAIDTSRRTRSITHEAAGFAGLLAGALIAPATHYETEDLTLVTLTAGLGSWHGLASPYLWSDDVSPNQRKGGALYGAAGGALVGTFLSQVAPLDIGDQAETGVVAAAGNALGGGLGFLLDASDNTRASLVEGVGLGTLALGLTMSRYTEISGPDRALIAAGGLLGAWQGLWLPELIEGPEEALDDQRYAGGALFGLGAGVLTAGVLSQLLEVEYEQQFEGELAFITFSAMGAGLGLLVPDFDRRTTVGLMEASGLAGLVGGILLADQLTYERGDYALLPLGGALGLGMGLTLPTMFRSSDASVRKEERYGGALLGAGVGLLSAAALAQITDFDEGDVAEVGLFSVVGGLSGLGLGLMLEDKSDRTRFTLMDGGALLGMGAGLMLADATTYEEGAVYTLALGSAVGGLLGGFAPGLWHDDGMASVPSEQVGGGLMLGTSLGLGAGVLLDQVLELTPTERENVALGSMLGALSGSGLGLLSSEDDRVVVGLMQGLTLAGAVGVGATAHHFDYDTSDLALGGAYISYLTWHSLGLTLLMEGTDRQAAGVVMSTAGLGALTGIYLVPFIDLELADVLMLFAGNVWGTWIGGWGGAVLRDHLDHEFAGRESAGLTLVTTVLGSDIGLAVTGLVVSGLLDVEPTRFAVINLSGLGGMMVGMLAAGFMKDDPLRAGNIIGSLSGLALGALVTSFFDFTESPTWDELLANKATDKPTTVTQPAVKPLSINSWFPSAQVQPGPDGEEQYLFTVMGTFE